MKLSEAQRRELERIASYGAHGAPYGSGSKFFAPVRRLLRRQLVRFEPHPFNSNYTMATLTASGRAALEGSEK